MKIERLAGILAILLRQEKVTAPYLAKVFEVSRRTINRDVETLCMAGIPLVTERGAGGGISIMEGYRIDRTLFCTTEMQAILAGLRSLDSVSKTNRYACLMEKLSVGSSDMTAGDCHILIDLSAWQKEILAPKIEQIHHAILTGREISFTYIAPKGESRRTAEPYYLLFQWSDWYVWARCLRRQDFRLFKLGRMVAIEMGATFEKCSAPLPDLSAERVFPPVYRVKARIDCRFKWRLLEEYGPDSFVDGPDGSLLFSFDFTDRETIIRWIASFGDGAELLEPAWMRRDVAAFAENILKKYRES